MPFRVKLYRVGEGEHQAAEVSFEATSVSTLEDGSIRFDTATGSQTFAATTWGGFEFERVPGTIGRA